MRLRKRIKDFVSRFGSSARSAFGWRIRLLMKNKARMVGNEWTWRGMKVDSDVEIFWDQCYHLKFHALSDPPVIVFLLDAKTVLGIHRSFRHRQRFEVRHQKIYRRLKLLNVQRFHLFEHEFWHQLSVAFHLSDALHATVKFTSNRGGLFIRRVELSDEKKVTLVLCRSGR